MSPKNLIGSQTLKAFLLVIIASSAFFASGLKAEAANEIYWPFPSSYCYPSYSCYNNSTESWDVCYSGVTPNVGGWCRGIPVYPNTDTNCQGGHSAAFFHVWTNKYSYLPTETAQVYGTANVCFGNDAVGVAVSLNGTGIGGCSNSNGCAINNGNPTTFTVPTAPNTYPLTLVGSYSQGWEISNATLNIAVVNPTVNLYFSFLDDVKSVLLKLFS